MSDEEVKPVIPNKATIFVSRASKAQIANWIPEKFEGNRIVPERPIRFTDNMFVTDDKKKIKFIENSDAFKSGMVQKMEDEKAANRWIEQHLRAKEITSVTSSDVSTAGATQ